MQAGTRRRSGHSTARHRGCPAERAVPRCAGPTATGTTTLARGARPCGSVFWALVLVPRLLTRLRPWSSSSRLHATTTLHLQHTPELFGADTHLPRTSQLLAGLAASTLASCSPGSRQPTHIDDTTDSLFGQPTPDATQTTPPAHPATNPCPWSTHPHAESSLDVSSWCSLLPPPCQCRWRCQGGLRALEGAPLSPRGRGEL